MCCDYLMTVSDNEGEDMFTQLSVNMSCLESAYIAHSCARTLTHAITHHVADIWR